MTVVRAFFIKDEKLLMAKHNDFDIKFHVNI